MDLTKDLTEMSTAVPRGRHVQGLVDMNTQYSLPADNDTSLSVRSDTTDLALLGGGNPKYVPYNHMKRL